MTTYELNPAAAPGLGHPQPILMISAAVAGAGYEAVSAMSALNRHFARHYVEMVVAMFLGMAVLGLPAGWGLTGRRVGLDPASGRRPRPDAAAHGAHDDRADGRLDAPPRPRLQPCLEMSASMIGPTFAVIGLLGAGLAEDTGTLLITG